VTERSTGSPDSPGHAARGASLSQRLRAWFNTLRNNREFRRGRTVLKSMPQTVFIDTGNVCICIVSCAQAGGGRYPLAGS